VPDLEHVPNPGRAEHSAHQQIFDAIVAGDAPAAEKAVRDHLVESNTAMVRSFFEGSASL